MALAIHHRPPNMGIGGITPAIKLQMAAQVLRMHPVKNERIIPNTGARIGRWT
jgi:hypothetical protein